MRRVPFALAAAVLALGTLPGAASAQTPAPDQIEEDWQVVVGTPDTNVAGPQISTTMSPVGDNSQPVFVFDMNYNDYPSFTVGGMQVQVWSGESMLNSAGKTAGQLNTVGETITWTQRLKVSSGSLTFAIDSGRSTTWGKFGQGQQLNVGGNVSTTLTNLSGYSPSVSVASSGVGWERNRVTSMTLVQVRYYAGGKLLSKDTTSRSVDLTK